MSGYLSLAAGAVFLSVVVSFIIPEGKLNKTINFVMRLVCIFILVQPVTSIFNMDEASSRPLVDYQYICSVYSSSQSLKLQKMINEQFDVDCVCTVDFIYSDGSFVENGVTVEGNFKNSSTINQIYAYLRELGYIDITVNEKTD